MVLLTLATAFNTPLPENLLGSLSLNSIASCAPVLAPDGTLALPTLLSDKVTDTLIVGLDLESKIS